MSTFALENPNTGRSEEEFPRLDDAARDDILDRSTAAFNEWRTTSIDERAAILARTADLYEKRIDKPVSYTHL